MLCNKCNKNEATHFLEKNINGKVTKLALCSECARESGEFNFNPFSGLNLLSGFFDIPAIKSGLTHEKKRCSLCASTFDDIINNGKVGCAKCYEIFADELSPTIRKIHGDVRHVGRRPLTKIDGKSQEKSEAKEPESKEIKDDKSRIKDLKKELNGAVKSENYELAAKLRDEIRSIESGNSVN